MRRADSKVEFLALALVLLALVLPFHLPAAEVQHLTGHVPAVVARLRAEGDLAATNRLHLAIGLPLRNPAELTKLLAGIYHPGSTNYHHYLSARQFTEQFGPSTNDYESLTAFLQTQGLTVTGRHANRTLLDVAGSVGQIEQAFHTRLRLYPDPRRARSFYAPAVEPSLDLSVPVLHISGLDNWVVPHPMNLRLSHQARPAASHPWLGSAPGGAYWGYDFRTAYVPGTLMTGQGQEVGLLQLESGFFQSDITQYENDAGLPNVPVTQVLVDGYDGGPGLANNECSLDIEMAISMAPGLLGVLVYEGNVPDDVLNQMATDDQAQQLSSSYSFPTDALTEQIFQEFAAQGQSFFNASGDDDAWIGGVAPPCDDTNITIVGGTTLSTDANGAWSAETVWQVNGTNGSGGGVSATYDIPAWQQGVNMSANQGSTTMRNLPDVALTADNVYVYFGDGSAGWFGGTSCASPLWAGFTALVNQQAANNGVAAVGFANPAIYALGESTNYPSVFHDVVTGNNTNEASDNLYFAVPGYDLCTGWGTPAGQSLMDALVGPAKPTAPVLTTQPQSQTVTLGTSVSLSVVAGGYPPPSYQWEFDGTNVAGATNETLTLNNVQLSQAGNYTVLVTNLYGSVPSSIAVLTVDQPSDCDPTPAGLVSWWAGEGNANDVIGSNNGVLEGGVDFTTGEVGQGFWYYTTTADVRIPASASLDVGGSSGSFTVEAWINCWSVTQLNPIFEWNKNDGVTTEGVHFYAWSDGSLYANVINTSGNNFGNNFSTSPGLLTAGTFYHVALTYDNPSGIATIYCDGNVVAQVSLGQFTPLTSYDLFLGRRPPTQGETYTFAGVLDEPSLYNRALAADEIAAIYNAGAAGKCPVVTTIPPSVIAQPTNETVEIYSTATFSVVAAGTAALNYQWFYNGTNIIAGATNSILTLTNVQVSEAGWYSVIVTNDFGSIQSSNALLTILTEPPTIVTQPANDTLFLGGNASFAVSASGTLPLYYQWMFNQTNIPGATNATLILNNVQVSQDGNYSVLVTNAFGSALSSNALLTVYGLPPAISTQPASQPVDAGFDADFNVVASGSTPLTFQWLFHGSTLPGATNAWLILTNVQPNQAGAYTVLVTNYFGSALSSNAILTVNPLVACTTAPSGLVSWWPGQNNAQDLIGTNNGSLEGGISFTSGVVGQAFYFNNTNADVRIPASGSLNLGLGSAGFTLEAWVSCVNITQLNPIFEWNQGNDTTSEGVHFYVYSNGALYGNVVDTGGNVLAHDFQSAAGLITTNQFYHVALTFSKPLGLESMYLNGVLVAQKSTGQITPLTSYNLYLGRRPPTQSETYSFAGTLDEPTIYNRPLTQAEIQAVFTAGDSGKCIPPPIFVTQPTNMNIKAGTAAAFITSVTGANPLGFQWYWNNLGNPIPGATNANLTFANVQPTNAGTYLLLATNFEGTALSSNATLVVHLQDHFAWSAIPSPRFVRAPFTATIVAQNATNGVVANFTGTVTLTSSLGIPVQPAVSGAFVRGSWTGSLVLAQPATNLVLKADDGLGDTGLANTVSILNPPALGLAQYGNVLLVYWPTNVAGFKIETAPHLNSTNWVPVGVPPDEFGSQYLEAFPMTTSNGFYRLFYTLP